MTLRFATYNLKNLFLSRDGEASEIAYPKPNKEVRPLARMIDQVNADVMVLQEVGSLEALERLNGRLQNPYPHLVCLPGNSRRSIHLGALSRLAVRASSHREADLTTPDGAALMGFADEAGAARDERVPLKLQRDVLCLELDTFTAFVVHLKSQGNAPWQETPAHEIRAAEARMAASIVAEYEAEHPGVPLLVAGDFNDVLSSDALAPIRDLRFYDVLGASFKDTGVRPSTYWPKRRMVIDLLLLSDAFAARYVTDSVTIHRSQMARTASDHYPVSLQVQFPQEETL